MSIKRIEADVDDRARDSVCYFCNEMFEMGKLQNHLKQCGSILEQCPLRCGAWIQRKHKDTHVKDCPQMARNREAVSPSHVRASDPVPPHEGTPTVHTWTPHSIPLEDCVSYLEKEITSIKLILTEESSHRDIQSTEIDNLRSKLVLVEERAQHFLSTLVSLRAAVDDEAERSANWAAQFKHDLANVQLALQELQSQQMNTAMRLESVVNSLVHEQRERELLEQAMTDHDNKIRNIKALEEAVNYLKQTIEEERQRNEENQIGFMGEMVGGRLAIDRLAVLEVASADARAEASEQTAKMDLVSRDLRALTKSYHKLRNELIDFQSKVSLDNPELGGDNGHLIWRIDNFQARMKEAKEKDAVLTSPLFRTSKYGYTLKAELNLNGIGKWKGRHLTCTLRLVAGPYDQLLVWPCDLTINIVLKDQPANRSQATDVVKTLDLRRKSSSKRHDYDISGDDKTRSTESLDLNVIQMKKQYIFIPHTSLDKFEYIKNDVMFLEFIVNQ